MVSLIARADACRRSTEWFRRSMLPRGAARNPIMKSGALTRRQTFILAAAAGGAMVPTAVVAAAKSPALVPGAEACVLTPELEEGPYYFDPELQRSDIREGHEGAPLRLLLQV